MSFLFRRAQPTAENPFLDAHGHSAPVQQLHSANSMVKANRVYSAPVPASDSLSGLTLSDHSDGSDAANDSFSLHSNSAATMSAQKEDEILEENTLLRQQLVRLADQVAADEERKEFEFARKLKEVQLEYQKDLDELNAAHEQEASEWQKEMHHLRAELQTSQSEVSRLSARAAHLADDLDQARERCGVLQGQVEGMRRIARLEAEAEDLHSKLADAHRTRIQAQAGLKQQEELVESLKVKYGAVSSHLIELREDHNRLLRILETVRPSVRPGDIRRAYTLRVATSRLQDPSLAEHGVTSTSAAGAGTLHLGGAKLMRKGSASIPRRRHSPGKAAMMAAADAVSPVGPSPGPIGGSAGEGDKAAVLDVVQL
ncbi:hypothetical protein HDU93_000627 [Gonapodya sp. JEL0774]|nr:hypothetical protein HDU93_000627 [Gonapodya sp. JEL0774]